MKSIHSVWRISAKSTLSLVTLVGLFGSLTTSWGAFDGEFNGTSSGQFFNPQGGPGMVTAGVGTSLFKWGSPILTGSSLEYVPSTFEAPVLESFQVGTLEYYNATSEIGSGASSVDLDLTVEFTDPSGIDRSFDYTISINNTPNATDPDGPADSITLGTFPDKSFEYEGITYLLSLSFGTPSGGVLDDQNRWYLAEMTDETVGINGMITVVPEPSSILAGGLLMLPFAGWLFRAARQRTHRS